jgi:hypothetical protein
MDHTPITIEAIYDAAPMTERTLIKNGYRGLGGAFFLNDMGHPCHYRIVMMDREMGVIQYYRGRKLACHGVAHEA